MPISPDELREMIRTDIPDFVLDAVDHFLIAEGFKEKIIIQQNALVDYIVANNDIERSDIFSKKYLDFENHYRRVGWTVNFVKRPYYTDESDYFVFSTKAGE